jgi:nucleotide-binding universal stress UspA family protein
LQVISSGRHVRTIGGLDYIRYPEQLTAKIKEEARQYLEVTGKIFSGSMASVRSEVRTGDAAEEIIRMADESKTSLVAMSTHGHSGIELWVLGNVAQKVLHHGHSSILLVKR